MIRQYLIDYLHANASMEQREPIAFRVSRTTHLDIEDPNFDRKLDLITAGAKPFIKKHLLTRITKDNCLVIINYILAFQTEVTLQRNTE